MIRSTLTRPVKSTLKRTHFRPETAGPDRRGVLYTFVALILLLVVGGIFFTQSRRTGSDELQDTRQRVLSMDRLLQSLEQDGPRAAYIAGFRSLIAMEQHVASTGSFITDPQSAFLEGFMNGSIGGTNYTVLQNATFTDYVLRVVQLANQSGVLITVSVDRPVLWQADPWHMRVDYTLRVNLTDSGQTASWAALVPGSAKIPITDVRDPIFTARTYGRVQQVIKPWNGSPLVDDAGNGNDTSGLGALFNHSLYLARGRGPTLLMRFSGNLSDNVYGIESLVDTDELIAQGLTPLGGVAVIDYRYFRNESATVCQIQNMPSRFKITDDDLSAYEIAGQLNYTACP